MCSCPFRKALRHLGAESRACNSFFIFDGIDGRNNDKFPLLQRFKTIAISFGPSDLLDPKGTDGTLCLFRVETLPPPC